MMKTRIPISFLVAGLVFVGVAVFARWAGPNPPGYTVAAPTEVLAYECGGMDVPDMTPARINAALTAEQVGSVTICRHPAAAGFTTWTNVDTAGREAAGDGPAVSQAQVQALLDALATPDELLPMPNSCTAIGVTPADPLYLTLVNARVLQPVIPVDHCDRQTERARQVIDSFPDGT
ncbi:MAG TPA: hypothetical protein DCQ04_06890 [Actinobacteria bacterium]|nr:hypothetical protein [Actinomycetota bacterium]